MTSKEDGIQENEIQIRPMTKDDYDEVHSLWLTIKGMGIRALDDSKEDVVRFIERNPQTSVVAVKDGRIVGSILCGSDGRQGTLYHVCVARKYRRQGIGRQMVGFCMKALRGMGINRVSLIAFTKNEVGNAFWKGIGWQMRKDCYYYDFVLNENNITRFIGEDFDSKENS